jgi:signal transduction histidine kinase
MIQESIDYTRSLLFDLSPPTLHEVGLEAALDELAGALQQEHGVRVRFCGQEGKMQLPEETRIALYRATRELLLNAVKHAGASAIRISTKACGKRGRVQVEDDGVGFDPSAVSAQATENGGFGLFSVRERLSHLGGELDISSRPGQGTVATLTVPLRNL